MRDFKGDDWIIIQFEEIWGVPSKSLTFESDALCPNMDSRITVTKEGTSFWFSLPGDDSMYYGISKKDENSYVYTSGNMLYVDLSKININA